MKKKIICTTVFVFTVLFTFTNCNSGTVTESDYLVSYNRTDQLKHLYDNEIFPLHTQLVEETKTLKEKVTLFSTTQTEANFIELQNQWKKTTKTWKRCELFDIGIINTSFIHYRIHRWPIDTDKIESYIDGINPINISFIENKGSSTKGIAAIEYILFNYNKTSILTDQRKIDYLKALATNLHNNTIELHSLWKTYENSFKETVENGISGSQNRLLNAIVSSIEETIQTKIGKALGSKNGGNIDTHELEAYRSEYSLELMQSTLLSIKNCFTGDFGTNTRKIGFNSYIIAFENETLITEINAAILNCETQLEAINQSLEATIINDTNQVALLKESFKELLYLIKIDVSSFIGSTLTFNDNDGD